MRMREHNTDSPDNAHVKPLGLGYHFMATRGEFPPGSAPGSIGPSSERFRANEHICVSEMHRYGLTRAQRLTSPEQNENRDL